MNVSERDVRNAAFEAAGKVKLIVDSAPWYSIDNEYPEAVINDAHLWQLWMGALLR